MRNCSFLVPILRVYLKLLWCKRNWFLSCPQWTQTAIVCQHLLTDAPLMQLAVDAGCAWVGTGSWTAMFNLLHASFTPTLTFLSQVPNLSLNFDLNPDLPSSLFKLFILTGYSFLFSVSLMHLSIVVFCTSVISQSSSALPTTLLLHLLPAFGPNCPPQQSSIAGPLSLPSRWHSFTSLCRNGLEMSDNVHYCHRSI